MRSSPPCSHVTETGPMETTMFFAGSLKLAANMPVTNEMGTTWATKKDGPEMKRTKIDMSIYLSVMLVDLL